MVKIIKSVIYAIDYENQKLDLKIPSRDMTEFIFQLAEDTSLSRQSQLFTTKSNSTQVVNLINRNINAWISNSEDEFTEMWDEGAKSIAQRLLDKEIMVQSKMNFGIDIKKGSLLQALIYDEDNGVFNYLLTKIEHKGFFEEVNYNKLNGFSADKNKFFKSCLFTYISDEDIEIDKIEVFLDNKAIYWTREFLEIIEIRKDESNTSKMFTHIQTVLKNNIYKSSRHDYQVYRNHLLGYMRSQVRIHYDNLIEEVFKSSAPDYIGEDLKSKLLEELADLPEKKSFDREFNCVQKVLSNKHQSRAFELTAGVQLVITGYMPNEMEDIEIERSMEGPVYIKIKTNNQELIETFDKKE